MTRRLKSPSQIPEIFALLAAESDATLVLITEGVLETTRFSIEETFGKTPPLAPLQQSTIDEKSEAGYPDPEAPVVASGAARASYETHIAILGPGVVAGDVSSDDPVMVFQEFGTVHIPPRPVTLEGAEAAAPAVKVIVDAGARELAMGKPEPSIRVPSSGRPPIFRGARR
jgi:hypothetical protein